MREVTNNSHPMLTMPITISAPPTFENNKYELYRKELLWWRDLHFNVADAQLIIKLTLCAHDDIMKPLLMQFLETTRSKPQDRTMILLLSFLDAELKKSAHETALSKVTIWSNFSRKPSESIRSYWIRFAKLEMSLTKSGVIFPPEVAFYKALSGLRLVQPNLGMIMGALEACKVGYSLTELKRITIRVLETTFQEPNENILHLENTNDNNGAGESENGGEEEEEESESADAFMGADNEIYELRKVKKVTGGVN